MSGSDRGAWESLPAGEDHGAAGRPAALTVYLTVLFTFIGFSILTYTLAAALVILAVTIGLAPRAAAEADLSSALLLVTGHAVWELLLGLVIIGLTLTTVAVVASALRAPPGEGTFATVARRLRLGRPEAADVLLAVVGMFGLASALDALLWLLGLAESGSLGHMRGVLQSLDPTALAGAALLLGGLPGLAEELFFRGWVLRRLELAQGRGVALAMSSLLFGLFHVEPIHASAAAVMGLFLGWVVLRTRNLWPAIVAHAVNNALAALAVHLEVRGPLAVGLLGGGLALCLAMVFALARRHRPSAPPAW